MIRLLPHEVGADRRPHHSSEPIIVGHDPVVVRRRLADGMVLSRLYDGITSGSRAGAALAGPNCGGPP
ncbi:hypothetical protein CHELA40_30180 [Chelatococcus asaccharovorans]|nr:hypothetical protein CHELA17_40234 [Chelatococcus asaccharovorans]CAH1688231.1 hypothetical protein CHELA40_30180 [Chelatococcus asaccharovorans]